MGCSSSQPRDNFDKSELSVSRIERVKLDYKSSSNKILTDTNMHRIVAETNLKAALTHPTVVSFFRKFTKEKGTESMLNFYLEAIDLRASVTDKNSKNNRGKYYILIISFPYFMLLDVHLKFQSFAQKYLIENAVELIPLKSHSKNMIMSNIKFDGQVIPTTFSTAMEGVRLAQYEVLFSLKVNIKSN